MSDLFWPATAGLAPSIDNSFFSLERHQGCGPVICSARPLLHRLTGVDGSRHGNTALVPKG
jgi:hypothetical protein